MGRRGSGSARYSGALAAKAAGNIVLQKDMAMSIGQCAPVFLPREPPSLTENPGRPQSTRPQRVGQDRSNPECIDARLFIACGSSAPVRAECEGGTAAQLAGTLAVRCAGTQTASTAEVMAPQESFFEPLVAGHQKASLTSLSPQLHPFRHIEGPPGWGPPLQICSQGLKGESWVSPTPSVCQWFDGPAFLFSCWCLCGEKEAMVMASPPTHDSAVSPCFHGCLAFFHQHFPP